MGHFHFWYILVMKQTIILLLCVFTIGSLNAQGGLNAQGQFTPRPTFVPKFNMKPGGGGGAGQGAPGFGSASQWKGLDECIAELKKEGAKSKAHVFRPSKETKAVVCEKTQYGEILHSAKFTAVFYMTAQGGKDFELPEYKNGNRLEAANNPAYCDSRIKRKQTVCCDAWLWDSSYIRCEFKKFTF